MCGIFGLLNYNGYYLTNTDIENSFSKGVKRGPEVSLLKEASLRTRFGFHRLAINGINEVSNQPITIGNIVLICNGEIYNYKELKTHLTSNFTNNSDCEDDFEFDTQSDCEIIIHLYVRYGMEATLNMIDGEFAFILLDKNLENMTPKLFVARDPYGVRPLFIMSPINSKTVYDNILCFASEQKMLIDLKSKINKENPSVRYILNQYKPATYSQYEMSHKTAYILKLKKLKYYNTIVFSSDITRIASLQEDYSQKIQHYLVDAVRKRVENTERPIACLLSGGLDSSIITSLVNEFHKKKFGCPVETYSIGLEGSNDLEHATIAAEYLQTKHTQIKLSNDEFTNAIPEVIYDIESYDTTTVRASIGNWLVSKYISENSNTKVIFNGDGADEVMGGYLYMKKANNSLEFDKECRRLLKEIHYFDVLRSDRSIANHGLEARTPFLDYSFVQMYLSIPIILRCQPHRMEKYLLRDAFSIHKYKTSSGKQLLPDEILSRRKEAFSDGVTSPQNTTKSVIDDFITKELDVLNLFTETNPSLSNDENAWVKKALQVDPVMKHLQDHNIPTTKEQYYYRRIFEQHYKGQGKSIPHFWMPRYVNANDSSARTLELYNE